MYYPPTIKEDAPSNSEVRDVLEEVEAVGPRVALAITSSEGLAKESEPFDTAKMNEGQNPDAPQGIVGSIGDASVSQAEGPVLFVEPLQAIPLGKGSKDLETPLAQLSEGGVETRSKE